MPPQLVECYTISVSTDRKRGQRKRVYVKNRQKHLTFHAGQTGVKTRKKIVKNKVRRHFSTIFAWHQFSAPFLTALTAIPHSITINPFCDRECDGEALSRLISHLHAVGSSKSFGSVVLRRLNWPLNWAIMGGGLPREGGGGQKTRNVPRAPGRNKLGGTSRDVCRDIWVEPENFEPNNCVQFLSPNNEHPHTRLLGRQECAHVCAASNIVTKFIEAKSFVFRINYIQHYKNESEDQILATDMRIWELQSVHKHELKRTFVPNNVNAKATRNFCELLSHLFSGKYLRTGFCTTGFGVNRGRILGTEFWMPEFGPNFWLEFFDPVFIAKEAPKRIIKKFTSQKNHPPKFNMEIG